MLWKYNWFTFWKHLAGQRFGGISLPLVSAELLKSMVPQKQFCVLLFCKLKLRSEQFCFCMQQKITHMRLFGTYETQIFWTLKPKLLVILWSLIWWFGCLSKCLSFCHRCWSSHPEVTPKFVSFSKFVKE